MSSENSGDGAGRVLSSDGASGAGPGKAAIPSVHLLTLQEAFVYKVPPMRGASGHRAADWDLEKPALTGEIRLVSRGDKVYLNIMQVPESSVEPPRLFASCPIKLDPDTTKPNSTVDFFVQPVTDSSRYFVVRVEDEASGRRAYIGIGFADRQSAFDLRAALDDELKRIARGEKGNSGSFGEGDLDQGEEDTLGEAAPAQVDRSLKEGETIKVNIKILGKNKPKKSTAGGVSLSSQMGKISLSGPPKAGTLSVPPGAAVVAAPLPFQTEDVLKEPSDAHASASQSDEDEFGDFS